MLGRDQQRGQVALVVLLIMSVTLVIALSLAKDTTDEISRTAQKGETVQIFSAAESGAGYLLTSLLLAMKKEDATLLESLTSSPDAAVVDESVEAEARADVSYGVETSKDLNANLAAGESTEMQLRDADGLPLGSDASVVFRWATEAVACNQASIIFARYYDLGDGNGTRVAYTAVGPNGCVTRNSTDGFEDADPADAGSGFANQHTMVFDADDLFVRILPVYHSTQLFASSADDLPIQQRIIRTEAINQLSEVKESQVVTVSTTNLQLPGYLDYAIYSGENLIK